MGTWGTGLQQNDSAGDAVTGSLDKFLKPEGFTLPWLRQLMGREGVQGMLAWVDFLNSHGQERRLRPSTRPFILRSIALEIRGIPTAGWREKADEMEYRRNLKRLRGWLVCAWKPRRRSKHS